MKSKAYKWIKISLVVFSFAIFLIPTSRVNAASTDNVFGSAWSDKVGWISFNNCPNPLQTIGCGPHAYGVQYNKVSSAVTGQAWNDNVGWISFNPSDWGGTCSPSGASCSGFTNKWQSGGWARAVSAVGNSNSGGWDGWISLGGSSYQAGFDSTTAVESSMPIAYQGGGHIYTIDMVTIGNNGYWWGDEVVGWIDLNPTSLDPINGGVFFLDIAGETLTLVAYKPGTTTPAGNVVAGDKVDIKWTAGGGFLPTSCTGTSATNPTTTINLGSGFGTTTTGFADWNATFAVTNPLPPTTSGTRTNIEIPFDHSSTPASAIAINYTLTCTDTFKTVNQTIPITTVPLQANMTDRGCVFNGNAPSFDWGTNDTTQACKINAVTAPGGSGVYTIPAAGNLSGQPGLPPATLNVDDTNPSFYNKKGAGPTVYTLYCDNQPNLPRTYQAYPASAQSSPASSVNTCPPNYSWSQATACPALTLNGTNYEATVNLNVSSPTGFTGTVTISSAPGTGTWTFTPNTFVYGGSSYSTVSAKVSMTATEYGTIQWKDSNGNAIPFFRNAYLDAIGISQKTAPVKFCEAGATGIKPIYKPF